jgi:Dyp-type peroxidase family
MPIDLATNPGPLVTSDSAVRDVLEDLQGNILSGHGRDYAVYLFLRFEDAAKARRLLSGLAQGSVSSALRQLQESDAFAANGTDGGLFVHTALSAKGYVFLDVQKLPLGSNPRQMGGSDGYVDAFATGMKARQSWLDDPQVADWEQQYRGEIHALILLAADAENTVKQAVTKLESLLAPNPTAPVAKIVASEFGFVQRRRFQGSDPNKPGEPVEHFGFVDNISQPVLLDKQIEEERVGWDPVAPPRLVLIKDPNGGVDGYGSFLVFRKLEQNVRGFWSAARHLSGQLHAPKEVVAAMAVGRFENGTPVVLSGVPSATVSRTNQFNYDGDSEGYRCPFQAHTRKTNPRLESVGVGTNTVEEERGHRIARRGIPYPAIERKDFDADPALLPERDVGMLFTCYQSDIWEQFEFQQHTWCNDPKFKHPSDPSNWTLASAYATGTGIDALVGQHSPESPRSAPGGPLPCNWPVAWDRRPMRMHSTISQFVTLKGGEYLFSPSISGLRSLDDGAPAIDLR